MTDIRRTLLWVVFTMSLFLLWDAWNKHTGQPSLFGMRPAPTVPAPTDTRAPAAPGAATARRAGADRRIASGRCAGGAARRRVKRPGERSP